MFLSGGAEMLNVAIVDDEQSERERIRSCLSHVSREKGVEFHVDEYAATEHFLMRYDGSYDLIFMDVFFGDAESGMEAARKLRKIDQTAALVFITNMAQMALHGYEVDALDFILKPVDRYAFALKMERVLTRIEAKDSRSITVAEDGELYRIRVSLIRYLKVQGHYVEYHSREGVFTEYGTLLAAEKKLDDTAFVRCDRGCLVNLRYVTHVLRNTCMVDGEELAVARTQKPKFTQAFSEFLSGRSDRR